MFVSWSDCSSSASENVYSMIQHPRDVVRPEGAVSRANGNMTSPRLLQGPPGHGLRAASPPCLSQRQVRAPRERQFIGFKSSSHLMFSTICFWQTADVMFSVSLCSPQTWSVWCTAASGQNSTLTAAAAPVTSNSRTRTLTDPPPSQTPLLILGLTATLRPPNSRRRGRWSRAGRRWSSLWLTHGVTWRRRGRAAVTLQLTVGWGQSRLHTATSPVWLLWGRDTCRRVQVLQGWMTVVLNVCFVEFTVYNFYYYYSVIMLWHKGIFLCICAGWAG